MICPKSLVQESSDTLTFPHCSLMVTMGTIVKRMIKAITRFRAARPEVEVVNECHDDLPAVPIAAALHSRHGLARLTPV